MTRKPTTRLDPLEKQIELAMAPGRFIRDGACYSFVSALEEVAGRIGQLTASDPARASRLYEAFLAAAYIKIEELDDSSGEFGRFVDELYCGWIKARQAEGARPDAIASRLLQWMDEDEYGFCYRLEKDAVKVMHKATLVAFVTLVRSRFDAAATAAPKTKGTQRDSPERIRRECGEILRTLYAAQKNVAAYIALAEETGLTAKDCHVTATLLASRHKPDEALAWVERGLDIDQKRPYESMSGFELAELKRNLLAKLGRGGEALDAAWADFLKHPSKYSYADLMKFVPNSERRSWHEKAIEAVKGAGLASAMELLLETKELEHLAECVRHASDQALEGLSHFTTEPVAEKLEKSHPDLAARLWRAQGLRIVNEGKSKYYAAAVSNLERAKRCFERAGMVDEWQKTVNEIRADHRRKTGFLSDFERMESGSGRKAEPSFIEEAKARWAARNRSTR